MDFLLYIITFIIGAILGNFCIAMIFKNSYKSKNKRNEKYRFIGSILVGLISFGIFLTLKVKWDSMTVSTFIEYLYLMAFVLTLIVLAGFDYKNKKINTRVIFLGSLIGFIHLLYLYKINNVGIYSIYKYILYFIIICGLYMVVSKNIYFKYSYLLEILMICIYINMFITSEVFLYTTVLTMISLVISIILKKQRNKIDKSDILAENDINFQIPIAMYLCISNIVAMIVEALIFS